MKPDRVATIGFPPTGALSGWVPVSSTLLRSAHAAVLGSPSRGPPVGWMEESFRESLSVLGYHDPGSSAGLHEVERPVEPASSAPPTFPASLLSKTVSLESVKIPQQRPQAFQKADSGPGCLIFLQKAARVYSKTKQQRKQMPGISLAHFCKAS